MSSTTAGQPAPDAAAPPPASPWRTPRRQLLVVSGVTLVFEALCGHQLEFVKIIKQTTRRPYPQIVREIVREKGLAGFWDGFLPWGAVQAVSKGAVFGYAYATSRSVLRPLVQDGRMRQHTADTLSGGLAGGVQGFVLSPTLLLKTRVMTDPVFRTQMSLVQTSVRSCQVGARVIVTEGPLSLMKGAPTFACKRVADWGSRYLFTNAVEDALFRRGGAAHAPAKLPYSQQMTASLLGAPARKARAPAPAGRARGPRRRSTRPSAGARARAG